MTCMFFKKASLSFLKLSKLANLFLEFRALKKSDQKAFKSIEASKTIQLFCQLYFQKTSFFLSNSEQRAFKYIPTSKKLKLFHCFESTHSFQILNKKSQPSLPFHVIPGENPKCTKLRTNEAPIKFIFTHRHNECFSRVIDTQ